MKVFSTFNLLVVLFVAAFSATANCEELINRTSYIAIPVSFADKQWNLAAKLSFPLVHHNGAAVLIVHGSGGVDSRGSFHASTLNSAGFVTLEIDLWAARGWLGREFGRPKSVQETLPDTFAALEFISALDGVDPQRVGLMGFSWGGVVSMLSRSPIYQNFYSSSQSFAANVAFYPVCWVYNKVPGYELVEVNRSPLLILTGELDDYDTATSCADWSSQLDPTDQRNVRIVVYPEASHGFNTSAAPAEVIDPFSHLGKGGKVVMKTDKPARELSDKAQLEFFLKHLTKRIKG
ncbi:MAG: dienelactone hydrolase [Oceanicoccus sp.]|jgi:dienelactone hydrolase